MIFSSLFARCCLLLLLLFASWGAACEDAVFEVRPAEAFFEEEAQRVIDPEGPDLARLAEAVFHETNVRREAEGLLPLEARPELFRAACLHARDMVEGDFFAHENPLDAERERPIDRVRALGLEPRFVAENIAQAFLLRYESGEAVYPREADGETVFAREPGGPPIEPHSYRSFAQALLEGWMASPGHRENILAAEPASLGAACVPSEAGSDMPMAYCVQLFFDTL